MSKMGSVTSEVVNSHDDLIHELEHEVHEHDRAEVLPWRVREPRAEPRRHGRTKTRSLRRLAAANASSFGLPTMKFENVKRGSSPCVEDIAGLLPALSCILVILGGLLLCVEFESMTSDFSLHSCSPLV